jgi:hypothetical protein
MAEIKTQTIGDRVIFNSPYHTIEFDSRLVEKKYPFAIGIYNEKYNDQIIAEIESSKIVKVDPDLSYYSQPSHASTLYLVPQPLFDQTKFSEVIYTLLQKLAQQYEE